MSSTGKVYIQVESEAEQEEHLLQQRKTLKEIQGKANDKENLTGREAHLDQMSRLKAASNIAPEYGKRKRLDSAGSLDIRPAESHQRDAFTQTIGNTDADRKITAEDLTSEAEPGEFYYKRLAEKRQLALDETLVENSRLTERIAGLETELEITKQEVKEAVSLCEILKQVLLENEVETAVPTDGSEEDKVSVNYDTSGVVAEGPESDSDDNL